MKRTLQVVNKDADSHVRAATLMPPSWCRTASKVVTSALVSGAPSVVCVFGDDAKNTKNVFIRLLANAFLFASGDVAVIDGDCVHPEFASPGMVSLAVFRNPLAAPGAEHFTHSPSRHPVDVSKSFFVGSSPKVNPALYLACVQSLIKHWRALDAPRPSLVVNCCGWTKGVGADLIGKVILEAGATHVVNLASKFESKFERESCASSSFWRKLQFMGEPAHSAVTRIQDDETITRYNRLSTRLYVVEAATTEDIPQIPSVPFLITATSGKKQRCESNGGSLQWLVWGLNCAAAHYNCSSTAATSSGSSCPDTDSFLYSVASPHQIAGRTLGMWDLLSSSFAQMPPWCIQFSDVHVYTGFGGQLVSLETTEALAGCMVGLGKRYTHGGTVWIKDCCGVGMIRALNMQSQTMYVIAPLSPSQLENVDCFLVRDVQTCAPPTFAKSAADGLVSTSPYVCSNGLATVGTGARPIRSRNNILRK